MEYKINTKISEEQMDILKKIIDEENVYIMIIYQRDGHRSNMCKQNIYDVGSSVIFGYGTSAYQ